MFQVFIRDLVRNLFREGNEAYQEGDWEGSLSHYSEALSIADYANSEEIHISDEVLEKLHVNRIACYSNKVICSARLQGAVAVGLQPCPSPGRAA